MKTIAVTFKGDFEIRRQDIVIFDEEDNKVDTTKLSADEIVDGLKKGKYRLDFLSSWTLSFDGEETYEFEVSED